MSAIHTPSGLSAVRDQVVKSRVEPAARIHWPVNTAARSRRGIRLARADRLAAAHALAQRYQSTVVLKGSGSVITGPEQTPVINASGNPLLATAGTGDVLAGMVGAAMAQGLSAFEAARVAVYWHGKIADIWGGDGTLTAFEMLDKIHYL